MKLLEWVRLGRPTNTPFYVRHNPKEIMLTHKEMSGGISPRLDQEVKKFLVNYAKTMQLHHAVSCEHEHIKAASDKIMNVERIAMGVYAVTVVEGRRVQASFIGWMMVHENKNGQGSGP